MSRPSRFEPKLLVDEFSPREHDEWAARMWRRMDRDHNGFISKCELDCEEFRSVLRKLLAPSTSSCMGGPRYARAQMNMDQAVSFFLRKADINGDGLISFEEFKCFMGSLRKNHGVVNSAAMIFALFDTDTDNHIEESEFREIYRFFQGHDPAEQEFQEEWGRLDSGGTGRVSRDQYISWLQQSSNPIFRWHSPASLSASPKLGHQDDAEDGSPGGSCMDSAGVRQGAESWRPWHNYKHFCWNEPTKGKPGHTKMKFRGTTIRRSSSLAGDFDFSTAADVSQQHGWNQRLATSHPNWPDRDGKPRQVVGRRKYFSRPQSLPELQRHLESHAGLKGMREAMFTPEAPRKRVVLSHEHDGGAAQVLSASSSCRPCGSMRHALTRQRMAWDDHWQTRFQLKDYYHPAPTTNIGPPARHLYADLYEDEA